MPTFSDEAIARKLWEDIKAQAIGVADMRGPGMNQVKYSQADEELLYMQPADGWTMDREWELLGFAPDGVTPLIDPTTGQPVKGKSRAEVGALKYPHRQKLAASGERFLDKYQQAKWLADVRKRLDPTWQPTPAPGSAPPTLTDEPAADGALEMGG